MNAEVFRTLSHPAVRQVLVCGLAVSAGLLAGCTGSDPAAPTPGGAGSGPSLSRLELFPSRRVAVVGEAIALKVIARDSAGAELTGVVPQYSTTNAAIVRIDPGGAILAAGVGTATVRGAPAARARKL